MLLIFIFDTTFLILTICHSVQPIATAEQIIRAPSNVPPTISYSEHNKEAASKLVDSALAELTIDMDFDGSELDSGAGNEFQALLQEYVSPYNYYTRSNKY